MTPAPRSACVWSVSQSRNPRPASAVLRFSSGVGTSPVAARSPGKSAETASRVWPTISTRSRRSCLFTPGKRRLAESVVV